MTKVEPIHKRDNKQNVKNYRLVSLLPIFGKRFERLLIQLNVLTFYGKRFNIFISGFKSGNSCINRLLSITHGIYQSLDQGYEVRAVFLGSSYF